MLTRKFLIYCMTLFISHVSNANSNKESLTLIEQKNLSVQKASTHLIDHPIKLPSDNVVSHAQFDLDIKQSIEIIKASNDDVDKKVRTLFFSLLHFISASELTLETKLELFVKLFSNLHTHLFERRLKTSVSERSELVYQVIFDKFSYLELLIQSTESLQSLFQNPKLIEQSLNSSDRVDSFTRLASVFSAFKQEVNNVENMQMQNNYAIMINSGAIDRNNPAQYLSPSKSKLDIANAYFDRFIKVIPIMTNSKLVSLDNDIIFLSTAIRIDSQLSRSYFYNELLKRLNNQKMQYHAKAVTLAYVAGNITDELDEMKRYQQMNNANPQLISFYTNEIWLLKQTLEKFYLELQIYDSNTFTADQWKKIENAKKKSISYIGNSGIAAKSSNILLGTLSKLINKTGLCKMNF